MSRRSAGLVRSLVLAVAFAPALGFAGIAHAAPSGGPTPPPGYNATINQGNVPTTAAAYSQDCNSDEFANKPAADDGWLFVASPSNFQKLEAQFNEGTIDFDGTNSGTAYYTKQDDHVAVITPGGWTLTQAFAQLDGDKDFFTLSHTCAASSTPPQQNTSPSATKTDSSCDSVTFSLSAGSQDTTFTVTPTNGSGTNVLVAAGQTTPYTVPVDAAHPGATVTAGGSTLASFTRPGSCDESSPGDNDNGGGGNNNGNTGGTTTGGDVSGVTGSTGTPATPGGTTTSVLGEKLTKTPTPSSHPASGVEATTVASLPMTGYAPGRTLQVAALCLGLGIGATVLGRRRVPKHHYIQVRN